MKPILINVPTPSTVNSSDDLSRIEEMAALAAKEINAVLNEDNKRRQALISEITNPDMRALLLPKQ